MDASLEMHNALFYTLKIRFAENMHRHAGMQWEKVQQKLEANTKKLWSLYEMERTGGEPDVVCLDEKTGEYVFYDCSEESPQGRRSLCYDQGALASRKKNKPQNSVMDMAVSMGIVLLGEDEYRALQKLGKYDTRTSSWIATPVDIREKGGALFADFRYGNVFVYHNGATSYYASRGFRGALRV